MELVHAGSIHDGRPDRAPEEFNIAVFNPSGKLFTPGENCFLPVVEEFDESGGTVKLVVRRSGQTTWVPVADAVGLVSTRERERERGDCREVEVETTSGSRAWVPATWIMPCSEYFGASSPQEAGLPLDSQWMDPLVWYLDEVMGT